MTLADTRDWAAIAAGVVAVATLVKAVVEYVHQGAQKRAEQFGRMRVRFKDNSEFREICDLLESEDPKLADVPFKDKRDLLGFFEEVALLVNSGLMRPKVAHYMFGYYAIRCWESRHFWQDINRDSPYWALFRDFAGRMVEVEKRFVYRRGDIRL